MWFVRLLNYFMGKLPSFQKIRNGSWRQGLIEMPIKF